MDWTDRFAVGIPAILLAACQTVGCRISIEYHTSVHRTMQSWLEQVPIAGWILWWIAETLLFGQMLRWLFVHAGRDKAVQEDGIGKRILLIFAGLLIAWLPVLLSNDPGFYNYDIYGQVPQVMYPEVPYNTHHSLLSTLVMGGVITLGYRIFGTMEKAVFLHSCFQMILCAATFSYSLDFWYRRLNRKWLLGVGFCFYAFLPTIALFSVSTTKDVVCSLALFIAFHLLYELYENTEGFFRKKEKIAALSCSLIVGALYRKNVIYAVFLYLVLCAVFCKKQKRKIISLFAGTILLTMLLSVGMETLLHACSRSKFLSKLLKTFDKTFREIFPVFISTKRREKPSAFFDNNFVNNAYFSEAASSSSSHLASSSSKAPISSRMTCLCLWSS